MICLCCALSGYISGYLSLPVHCVCGGRLAFVYLWHACPLYLMNTIHFVILLKKQCLLMDMSVYVNSFFLECYHISLTIIPLTHFYFIVLDKRNTYFLVLDRHPKAPAPRVEK